jgi:putative phosphoesterase
LYFLKISDSLSLNLKGLWGFKQVMKYRIGVLSDTHLTEVSNKLVDIYENYLSKADIILHAGDYASKNIVDFLDRGNFHGVFGNMDPIGVRESLPRKKIIQLGKYRLGLIHGWGSYSGLEESVLKEFKDVDVIIYGHSHHPANHIKGGVLLFNPGTAIGYRKRGPHTLGILEVDDKIHGEIINI